jgi:site-specific DNA-methyltransferase (adenine-specific)
MKNDSNALPAGRNTLYYGDNLAILRESIPSESVDLTYLDPPFNSNRNYNVLFREESGLESEAQITAFEDTWHWNEATARVYDELVTTAPNEIATMINAMKTFVGANQMMAYLVMMTVRLIELHRVLKSTGSLYLHCDPTASHYLKIILDTIFGAENYRSEVIWKRTSSHNSAKRFGPIHDTIFFYTKSKKFTWNNVYQPYDENYIKDFYRHEDEKGRKFRLSDLTGAGIRNGETGQPWRGINPTAKGRHWASPPSVLEQLASQGKIHFPIKGLMPSYKRYLDEMSGMPAQDVIMDIQPLQSQSAERLGYPTQKPVELLKRFIEASSNEGDVVLDAFCGCGTSIAAAQELNRQWIGIDITHLAIALQKYRLLDSHELVEKKDYVVIGEPTDLEGAKQLAEEDRYQFQWWALSLVQAIPVGSSYGSKIGKKGADRGIDGVINFRQIGREKLEKVLIQVKSGNVKSGDIRDLRGTITREEVAIGVFITLEKRTSQMIAEASEAGFYETFAGGVKYPKIQILTTEELLHGAEIKMPPRLHQNFKQAHRVPKKVKEIQLNLYNQ